MMPYSSNDYAGVDGIIINTNDLMAEFKYIPKEFFIEKVIHHEMVRQRYQCICKVCDFKYTILGYSPDFSWVAALCNCVESRAKIAWKGENFLRMVAHPDFKNVWHKHDLANSTLEDKLVQFIRGQTPVFEDVDQYVRSSHAAAISNYRKVKWELADNDLQLRIVRKSTVTYIEPSGLYTQYTIILRTRKTAVWCIEKQAGIDRLNLIPPAAGVKLSALHDIFPKHYGKTNERLAGKVYSITNCPQSNEKVLVTAVVRLIKGKISALGEFVLIPKPPKTEKKTLKTLTRKWKRFEYVRETGMISGEVRQANFVQDVADNSYIGHSAYWVLHIVLDSRALDVGIIDMIAEEYEGVDLFLSVLNFSIDVKVLTKRTGRVLSWYKDEVTGLTTLYAGVLVDHQYDILVDHTVEFLLWVLKKEDEREEENNSRDGNHDEEDESGEENDNWQENLKPAKVQTYIVKRLPHLSTTRLDDVLENFYDRPEPQDFYSLDFLLREKNRFVLHPLELQNVSVRSGHENILDEIQFRLNESQQRAMQNMMNHKVTTTIGPPGTGKSTCAALAIIGLSVKETGIIIATCPSNFATQILFEKLRNTAQSLGVEKNIVRMLSRSRERQDVNMTQALNNNDFDLLHNRIRRDPRWKTGEMAKIVERADIDGPAYLTPAERIALKQHAERLELEYLMEADIVCCTVGCAADHRPATLKQTLMRQDENISAVVIDEASLLTVPSTLQLLTLNPCRVWLIGDQNQLAPVIVCPSAKMACLDSSWMEILEATPYVRNAGQDVYGMLNLQYRMALEIATVVSRLTYQNQVQSARVIFKRDYSTMPEFVGLRSNFDELRKHNIGVYSYAGHHEQKSNDSHSIWNPKECDITKQLLLKLQRSNINLKKVCIIAMYDQQVKKLKEQIGKMANAFSDIQVATVDSMQGKEEDIIILNTVRSNSQNNIGFLRDSRRLNVAISRAKHYLLIVTNREMLIASTVFTF